MIDETAVPSSLIHVYYFTTATKSTCYFTHINYLLIKQKHFFSALNNERGR